MKSMFVDATAFSRNFFCDDSPLADSALTPTDFQGSAVSDMTCYDAMYPNGPFVMRNVNIRAVIKKVYTCNTSPSECTGNPPHSEGSPPTSSTLLSAFGSIENWDVSKVENMKEMFNGAEAFNQPIEKWDVSKVENMRMMFKGADAFNQAIENWDVSRVTNMKKLFIEVANSYYASFTFNANLSKWNVSRVVTMQDMLGGEKTGGLSAFNSQLSSWDISNVKSMRNGKIICLGFFF